MRPAESFSDQEGGSWDSHHCDVVYSDAEHREDAASSGASTPRGDLPPTAVGVFTGGSHKDNSPGKPSRDSDDESERKPVISKILSSKAESWIGKKGLKWPWKGNECDELGQQQSSAATSKSENQVHENEPSGSSSSLVNVNSSSSASSCGSTSSSVINKVDKDIDSLDYVILWEDLTIGDQIGQG